MPMPVPMIVALLVQGLGGVAVQVVLLRELLVAFYGNELTLGVILANWLFAESLGAYAGGRLADRRRNSSALFLCLQLAFILSAFSALLFSRAGKAMFGIPFGAAVGLTHIFFISLAAVFPAGFCHGALFSVSCKLSDSIALTYIFETIGTILGGVLLTYLLLPLVQPFAIVFFVSVGTLFGCALLLRKSRRSMVVLVCAMVVLVLSTGGGLLQGLQRQSLAWQWRGQEILEVRNSPYGNIAVTQFKEQRTFYYNGLPAIITPHPDIVYVEEFGIIPLLSHPKPERVLVLGGGAGGLLREILKHPLASVDYIELDPVIIELLQKYPCDVTRQELQDKRVVVKNIDPRLYLRTRAQTYDVIFIGFSHTAELSVNRFFTEEFFSLARARLNTGGLLTFCLPGSSVSLGPQLKDLNASIRNALLRAVTYVRVIPGDYTMYIASDDAGCVTFDPAVFAARIKQRGIVTQVLTPTALSYRLQKERLDWFNESLKQATTRVNTDVLPTAVFDTLILWNKQFSSALAGILQAAHGITVANASFIILFVSGIHLFVWRRRAKLKRIAVTYAIATTGFFSMLSTLILIFAFQNFYGNIYQIIGILISIFMAGTALGSFLMNRRLAQLQEPFAVLVKIEFLMLVASVLLALFIRGLGVFARGEAFALLFCLTGFLAGLEFPLAAQVYTAKASKVGATAGALYCADLGGGWLAGMVGGVILLPVLGLVSSCILMAVFKLGSLLVLQQALTKRSS